MSTLMIKDLEASQELDREAMASVAGGSSWYVPMPFYGPSFSLNTTDIKFDASQVIGQSSVIDNANGNNVAFAHGIESNINPTQDAHNEINFGSVV